MKTLKLTHYQILLLDELTEIDFRILDEDKMHILFSSNRSNVKLSPNEILVQDIDKFREFLNDEIDKCFPTDDYGMSEMLSSFNGSFYEGSESQKQDNLKSILNKLN